MALWCDEKAKASTEAEITYSQSDRESKPVDKATVANLPTLERRAWLWTVGQVPLPRLLGAKEDSGKVACASESNPNARTLPAECLKPQIV